MTKRRVELKAETIEAVWTADSPPAEERCQLLMPDTSERGGSFSPSPPSLILTSLTQYILGHFTVCFFSLSLFLLLIKKKTKKQHFCNLPPISCALLSPDSFSVLLWIILSLFSPSSLCRSYLLTLSAVHLPVSIPLCHHLNSFCLPLGCQDPYPPFSSNVCVWNDTQLPTRHDIIFLLHSQSEASTWSPAFVCTQERQRERGGWRWK